MLVSSSAFVVRKNQGSLKIKKQADYWAKYGPERAWLINIPLIDDNLI